MSRFIEGSDWRQELLLPDCVDDYVAGDSPVRVIDVFVEELDLAALGFEGSVDRDNRGALPLAVIRKKPDLDQTGSCIR